MPRSPSVHYQLCGLRCLLLLLSPADLQWMQLCDFQNRNRKPVLAFPKTEKPVLQKEPGFANPTANYPLCFNRSGPNLVCAQGEGATAFGKLLANWRLRTVVRTTSSGLLCAVPRFYLINLPTIDFHQIFPWHVMMRVDVRSKIFPFSSTQASLLPVTNH